MKTLPISYYNGDFLPIEEVRVSPLDRGFLFADGVYEVIPVYQGQPFRLQEHLDRLNRSLAEIKIELPTAYNQTNIAQILTSLIAHNEGKDLSIYLQITRGAPKNRDHAFPSPECTPTVFAMCQSMNSALIDQADLTTGVAAITHEDYRWHRCNIKSIALLPNLLLRQEAIEQGAKEAILIREGWVTEGSASNVFIVQNGVISTPPKSSWLLGGVTRDLVIELLKNANLPITERPISATELTSADEIWLSSSTKAIVPVTTLDNKPVNEGAIGSIWAEAAKLYRSYIADFRQACEQPNPDIREALL